MDCPTYKIHEIKYPTNISDFTVLSFFTSCTGAVLHFEILIVDSSILFESWEVWPTRELYRNCAIQTASQQCDSPLISL